jgi:Putative lumazine-binding
MRLTSPAAAVAAAALALAGCGGDGKSDKQKIEATLNAYYTAFADGDGAKACAQLTRQATAELVKRTRAKDCATAIEQASKRPDVAPYTERFRDAEVTSVDAGKKNAIAEVTALGQTDDVPLRKEDGKWKIEGADSAIGG